MKAMVIGLSPEYNYPGTFGKWKSNNTFYASNHGASLIPNALIRQFNADYISDFSDIPSLNKNYGLCVLALSTHVHAHRDVSALADVIEKLDMTTIAPSLGIQDYSSSTTEIPKLHPSVIRLLNLVSERSTFLGARGSYTANVLNRNGFSNVMPIGCPTLFWGLNENLEINKPASFEKAIIVYHRAMASNCYKLLEETTFLGQDYEDQLMFTDTLEKDTKLKGFVTPFYESIKSPVSYKKLIQKKSAFVYTFKEWFKTLSQHDFVFGPRIHGCLASLIQGIPAVLTPRDLRSREIAQTFNIPTVPFEELHNYTAQQIFDQADYTKFNQTYKIRYNNYVQFLKENGATSQLQDPAEHRDYTYTSDDMRATINILQSNIDGLRQDIENSTIMKTAKKILEISKRIPILRNF